MMETSADSPCGDLLDITTDLSTEGLDLDSPQYNSINDFKYDDEYSLSSMNNPMIMLMSSFMGENGQFPASVTDLHALARANLISQTQEAIIQEYNIDFDNQDYFGAEYTDLEPVMPTETLSHTAVMPTETLSHTAVMPTETLSNTAVIPTETLSNTAVMPTETLSNTAVMPTETLSNIAVMPTETLSNTAVMPTETLSNTAVMPTETLSNTAVMPTETLSNTAVMPTETLSNTAECGVGDNDGNITLLQTMSCDMNLYTDIGYHKLSHDADEAGERILEVPNETKLCESVEDTAVIEQIDEQVDEQVTLVTDSVKNRIDTIDKEPVKDADNQVHETDPVKLDQNRHSSSPKLYYSKIQPQINDQSGEGAILCDICGKRFRNRKGLHNHQTSHDPLCCPVPGCGRSFNYPSHFKYHILTHSEERRFTCGCGKVFYTSQQLQVHERTHSAERPYSCTQCDKLFSTAGNLKNHMRLHTGEKPYTCTANNCDKGFAEISSLKKHLLTHSGVKPYRCELCNKGFTQTSSRSYHMKHKHHGQSVKT